VVAEADDLHTECLGSNGDLATDATKADDADGFSEKFMTSDALPISRAHKIGLLYEIAAERQQERKGMFRDGGVIHAGAESDRDSEIGCRCEVDFIEADSVFGHDLEARQRLLEDLARNGVVAAKESVKVAGEFEHSSFRERTAFANDFKSSVRQQIMMAAGGILK
jgi:hypothetical protein